MFRVYWRTSLPLHPPQLLLWQTHALKKTTTKKKEAGKEGTVTGEEIKVGRRERARERKGGRQKNSGREQVSKILPLICLSFTPLCSLVVWRGDWFSDAGVPLLVGPAQS